MQTFLRKKNINNPHVNSALFRSLTTFDLIIMGIGAIIGAGVFVLTGIAAATKAGPAIIIAYAIAGLASMFSALSYAELAASIGGTGSAYSYAYVGFGEIIAWVIGWNLLLEYVMAVSTVSIGWSGYVDNLLEAANIHLPAVITHGPFEGGVINLAAVAIIFALMALLCLGIRHSVRFNTIIVFIKLITIAAFISVACLNVNPTHWENFLPYGWTGVMQGAALVFFAYIGFDALSTAVEEAIDPKRSVPIGIIVSLIICTLIYIAVSGLLTAIVPYYTLNVRSPVSDALLTLGYPLVAGAIAAGAVCGLTTVMLVMYYGLTRICLAMSRDGLLPQTICTIHPRTRTPVRIICLTGTLIALIAGIVPINHVAELVNIGTLAAFAFVSAGVIILRITQPDLPRPFRLPFYPLLPLLGVIFCCYLMLQLPAVTWWRFLIWTVVGLAVYLLYGRRHSLLQTNNSPTK